MLERIAAALEIDSPDLFSKVSFTDEALKHFQEGVFSDLEIAMTQALTQSIDIRSTELKKLDK